MSQFNQEIKQKVAKEKLAAGTSLKEGKKVIIFDVCKLMCKKLVTVIVMYFKIIGFTSQASGFLAEFEVKPHAQCERGLNLHLNA